MPDGNEFSPFQLLSVLAKCDSPLLDRSTAHGHGIDKGIVIGGTIDSLQNSGSVTRNAEDGLLLFVAVAPQHLLDGELVLADGGNGWVFRHELAQRFERRIGHHSGFDHRRLVSVVTCLLPTTCI